MKDINTAFHREELEMLPTPELEKILFEELESDSTDRDSVLQILSILEERDSTVADHPAGAKAAWEKYLKDRDSSVRDLPKAHRKPSKWLGAVAAAIIVALTLLMTVPQAVGADSIFDIIGRWTQEIFAFFHESEPELQPRNGYLFQTDNPALQQIYDAVAAQGVTQPVVPTWIPEGYELVDLKVVPHGKALKIMAYVSKNCYYIMVGFEIYGDAFSNSYPKDKGDASIYECAGIQHYITQNANTWKTLWSTDDAECLIVVNESEDILYKMIDSVYLEGQ